MTIGPDFDGVLTAARAGEDWAFSLLYRDVNPSFCAIWEPRRPAPPKTLHPIPGWLWRGTWDRSWEASEHSEDGSSQSPDIGLSSIGGTTVADLSWWQRLNRS